MANFPGNPYATDSHGLTTESAAVVKAITLLAFEVRTANILAAARPLVIEGPVDASEVIEKLQTVAERLGYSSVKVNGKPQ